jgi:metal-responsive CopG/Arc/MetJ family transcriptional regulator
MYGIGMAENTSTVNISFREDLLKEIDEVARSESRTRSELVREAARMYIERKKRLDSLIGSLRRSANERGISEADVEAELKAYRSNKRS